MFESILLPFWIFLLITIATVAFLNYRLRTYKDFFNPDNIKYNFELLGFAFSVFAIIISLYTLVQSDKDRQDSDRERIRQEERYTEQRKKDSVQQIILDSSKQFLEMMNYSFANLNNNVTKITGKLENVPNQIDNISNSFQSLNEINKKQYSVIFEQYTSAQNELKEQKEEKFRESLRRPFISIKGIECLDGYAPSYLSVENTGELIGYVTKIVFLIPDTIRSDNFAIESVPSSTIKKDGFVIITSENLGEFKANTPYRLKLGWQFFNPIPEVFTVKYKIFYYNKNRLDSTISSFKMCNLTH